MKTKINIKKIIFGALILIVGIFLGKIFFGGSTTPNNHKSEISSHEHDKQANTIWTCSMHPQIRQDKPGLCPICGMDLIPLYDSDEEGVDFNQIQLSESAMKLAEIQTTIVTKGKATREILMTGKVSPDETRKFSQTAHLPGRIEKLFVNFTGDKVFKGQKIARIYSPELVTAQKELFEALKMKDRYPAMSRSAREKLKLWKLSDKQISEIELNGEAQIEFDVYSDHSGYVNVRKVSEGDYVKTGQTLLEIINLSRVWVMFDAYENDISWIKIGQKIELTVSSLPGKTFKSVVTYIDPFINQQTRVAKIRAELSNPNELLKPEMFVNGRFTAGVSGMKESIIVPKTAVLWTGKRSVVYVKNPDSDKSIFEMREVRLGSKTSEFYIIEDGLIEGEEIATNGVFKIDAAAQLAGKPSMMNPKAGVKAQGHDHSSEAGRSNSETVKAIDMSDETPAKFKKQISQIVNAYIDLKNALVKSEIESSKKFSGDIISKVAQTDMKALSGVAHDKWMKYMKVIKEEANKINKAKNIDEQRLSFISLSNAIIMTVRTFGSDNQLYLDYCPMADDDKGAYWLSEKKEILNPYFGDMMLKCGEIKETLK